MIRTASVALLVSALIVLTPNVVLTPVAAQTTEPRPDAARAGTGTNLSEVEKFVADVYLDDGTRGTITTPFADKVMYYGRLRSKAELVADKRAYYARWTERRYTLDPPTLRVARSTVTPGGMDVDFEYTFALSNSARQAQGRGRARLTVVRDGDGIAIVREEGEVIRR